MLGLFKRNKADKSQSIANKLLNSLEKDRARVSKRILPIDYRGELTNSLKADHQTLLKVYMEILDAAQNRDYPELSSKLGEFKLNLKAHLAEEFKDLYVFVEHYAHDHSLDDKIRIREFRNEMNIIGGTVMGIINKYDNNYINDQTIDGFVGEFGSLGSVLTDRIKREETLLYPMYDDYGARFGLHNESIQ